MPTDRYAVFGQPIKHSKSPRIHALFAQQTQQDIDYQAEEVSAVDFNSAVACFFNKGGKGLNCTVPLKELAWEYADQLSERAQRAKAVNTLWIDQQHKVQGDNTDGCGLLNDLCGNHQLKLTGQRILILGAGGATRGIIAPLLAEAPADIVISNRTLSKAEAIVGEFSSLGAISSCAYADLAGQRFHLIINATSASLSADLPPLPARILAEHAYCYDLAYANTATAFVAWGKQQGAVKSLDGLGMLVEQAAEAFHLWRGVRPDTQTVIALLNRERELSPAN